MSSGPAHKDKEDHTHSCCQRALAVLRSRDFYEFYLLISEFVVCTFFYYFGELVDIVGTKGDAPAFFYGVHDVQRALFLAPIIHAGYVYRVRGALIVSLATYIVFLPRALFVSEFADPLLRASLFAFVAGVIGILTAMVRNGTERQLRLKALMRTERDRLLGMLEMMEEGVLLVDPEYRVRFMNRSMAEQFGDGLGTPCYQYLHSLDRPCDDVCRLPAVVSGAIERWEYNTPEGTTYEVVASPFVDLDGTTCQLAVFRNITQRKKVEMELIELNRLKSELLSNVSHELKSPLTSIKGIVTSLLQKDVEWSGKSRDMLLTGISEETDRLASLVTNLLNMSKIEAGVWRPEKERRNITDVISETLDQQQWVQKKHIFHTDFQPELPEVCADYNQIKQVLINLIENAAAYSDEGTTITIRARVANDELEVSVSDQGVGIPAEELDELFEKFYRGTQRRQKPGGTGLGLAICQALVEAHGGRLWVDSEVLRGSTFYFALPIAAPCDR